VLRALLNLWIDGKERNSVIPLSTLFKLEFGRLILNRKRIREVIYPCLGGAGSCYCSINGKSVQSAVFVHFFLEFWQFIAVDFFQKYELYFYLSTKLVLFEWRSGCVILIPSVPSKMCRSPIAHWPRRSSRSPIFI